MAQTMSEQLTDLTDRLVAVVRAQHEDQDPAHEDFYAWGSALTEMLDRADQVLGVLGDQVERYGDRRVLRDDEGADPAARLSEIAARATATRNALGPARERVREFHSSVSHIAVEVDPYADSDSDSDS